MKLSCPSCQARYVIADDKVHGRVVKIRCRRCGAIVVAREVATEDAGEPATATVSGARRTGERNEQSVLFSLAALRQAPAPATAAGSTSDASGLIDIQLLSRARPGPPARPDPSDAIAHLGCGGIFGPQLLPGEPEAASLVVAPRNRGRKTWPAVAIALAIAVGSTLGLRRVTRSPVPAEMGPSVLPSTSVEVATASVAEPGNDAAGVAETRPPPIVSVQSVPPVRPPPSASARVTAAPSASTRVAESPGPCCAGETETACAMRRAVGVACGRPAVETPAAFDSAVAGRALAAVNLRRCVRADTPVAAGHARLTFQPSGEVVAVVVDTPELAGTSTARCVAQAYRGVRVAAFSGSAVTVGKRFVIAGGP